MESALNKLSTLKLDHDLQHNPYTCVRYSFCFTLFFNFQWINAHTVVALDTTERIHLISVQNDKEIEVSDLDGTTTVLQSWWGLW